MEFIEACRKLVAIDSTPGNGSTDIADFVTELLQSNEFLVANHPSNHDGLAQANVVARLQPAGEEEFLLTSHLDTDDPGNYALWTQTQKNPFDAVINDGRIFGLGTAKCKLDLLCKAEALKEFRGRQFKVNPVLAGTFGMHQGMVGAIHLVRHQQVRAKRALVGEPTDLRLVCAGKGVAVVEIMIPFSEHEIHARQRHNESESSSSQSRMFTGKPASVSDPSLGDSAIMKMLEYLEQLPEGITVLDLDGGSNVHTVPSQAFLEFDLGDRIYEPISSKLSLVLKSLKQLQNDFNKIANSEFEPPASTLNVGTIRTFTDHIYLAGSCRLVPDVSQNIYEDWMNKVKMTCAKVGAQVRLSEYKRPFCTNRDSEFVGQMREALQHADIDAQFGLQSKSNEANVFSHFGIESVIFGPGEAVGNARMPNESVAIKDLHKAIEVYKAVIERICL